MTVASTLTDRDITDIQADLEQARQTLDWLDNTEPLPHMLDHRRRRRAACVAYIDRLEGELEEGRATVREDTPAHGSSH